MPDQIFVYRDNQQQGPLAEAQLREMIQTRAVTTATPCWYEGLPQWTPLGQVFPALFMQAPAAAPLPQAPVPAQPAPAPMPQQAMGMAAAPGSTTFEVLKNEYYRMPKITIQNEEVVLEAGALHYLIGQIQIEAQLPSVGGFLKSALTKEKAVRPRYRGTGQIFLEPTFADVNILELNGEEWILDRGAFLAADRTIVVDMFTNKAWTGLFGGEGFFQTKVCGHGKVMYVSQGPIERIDLRNEILRVDGSFAVARTASVGYALERATKSFFGSMMSGEGVVSSFTGTGTVLLAPVPNRFFAMMREFGGLHVAISRIKSN